MKSSCGIIGLGISLRVSLYAGCSSTRLCGTPSSQTTAPKSGCKCFSISRSVFVKPKIALVGSPRELERFGMAKNER